MTRQMTVAEVKAKLLALIDEMEGAKEIEITRHGITVARLAAPRGSHSLKGRFADIALSTATDEDLFTIGADWNLH